MIRSKKFVNIFMVESMVKEEGWNTLRNQNMFPLNTRGVDKMKLKKFHLLFQASLPSEARYQSLLLPVMNRCMANVI